MPWHFGGPELLTVREWKAVVAYFDDDQASPGELPAGWEALPVEEV